MTLDPTGRASGRGAYLCADGSCWTNALKKRAIERALAVQLPGELRVVLEGGPRDARRTGELPEAGPEPQMIGGAHGA